MTIERRTSIENGDHVVTLTRAYSTAVDELWPSLVDPDGIAAWGEPVEGDLREGGRYLLKHSGTSGTILGCRRHEGLSLTWEYEGDVSAVSIALKESAGGTLLTLTHTAGESEHWNTYGPAAAGAGWEEMLHALAVHLGEAEAMEDEAAFVQESTAAWAEADAASGTDEATARTRAERTAAFYLGEE